MGKAMIKMGQERKKGTGRRGAGGSAARILALLLVFMLTAAVPGGNRLFSCTGNGDPDGHVSSFAENNPGRSQKDLDRGWSLKAESGESSSEGESLEKVLGGLFQVEALAAAKKTDGLAGTLPDTSDNGEFENEGTHIIIDAPVLDPGLTVEKVLGKGVGYTTMHVCSTLTGNHGLCVLLENVSASGKKTFGLIDTGNASSSVLNSFLKRHGVESLAFLVLTHMHKDHVGNAVYLLSHYSVASLYLKQYDAAWSEGVQAEYEKILRAAVRSSSVKKIVGVSYALSVNPDASPTATQGFVNFLKEHSAEKGKFRGLLNQTNTTLMCGNAILQLFNWEIWSQDGVTLWKPGVNRRGRAGDYSQYSTDNNFSLGVRVTQGSHRMWIGGDINDLRLMKKSSWMYQGDEGRLKNVIGRVDAAILNHHGRGGSNTPAFLKSLSPKYVIYTSTRASVTDPSFTLSMRTWNYLINDLHLTEDQILWACSSESDYPEDPSITISEKKIESAFKDGSDMEPRKSGKSPAGSTDLLLPLKIGRTYSSYDVTGDGKPDQIRVVSSVSSSMHSGLKIMVNQKTAWSTKILFRDAQPVSLLLLPGRRAYLCICILSPVTEKEKSGKKIASIAKGGSSGRTSSVLSAAAGAASGTSTKTVSRSASAGEVPEGKKGGSGFLVEESGFSESKRQGTVNLQDPASGTSGGKNMSDGEESSPDPVISPEDLKDAAEAASSRKVPSKETRIFAFYRYGKTKPSYRGGGSAGEALKAAITPGFCLAYDVLYEMPDPDFEFRGTPSIKTSASSISLSCTGSDALTGVTGTRASLMFSLVPSGQLLKLVQDRWSYRLVRGNPADPFNPPAVPASAKVSLLLFNSSEDKASASILPEKKKFTAERVQKNGRKETRYLITVTEGIGEPAKTRWWIGIR